jgi:uncharacterized protein (DUF2345 family)
MKVYEILSEDGRIVKGVNTTPDVGPGEIKTQAAKFGNTVDRDGRPPTLSKKVKGKSTNVLFNLGMTENFADGKRKGKSRPGRVKRAGASCNGSVTDLRKRAKNASGEKAKMYHWCANMKSGRNKS